LLIIYLKGFIERYNKKISDDILDEILCRKEMRKVLKGSVISYGGNLYFLKEGKETVLLKDGSLVSIHIHGDGTIKANYGDKIYQLELAPNKKKKRIKSRKRDGYKKEEKVSIKRSSLEKVSSFTMEMKGMTFLWNVYSNIFTGR